MKNIIITGQEMLAALKLNTDNRFADCTYFELVNGEWIRRRGRPPILLVNNMIPDDGDCLTDC